MFQYAFQKLDRDLRATEIEEIKRLLQIESYLENCVCLVGRSGVGKSKLLELMSGESDAGAFALVDLSLARHRNPIGIASSILSDLPLENTDTFFSAAAEARIEGGESKIRAALKIFFEVLSTLANDKILIAFDNIDSASLNIRKWIKGELFTARNAKFLCAAKVLPIEFQEYEQYPLNTLGGKQIVSMRESWKLNHETEQVDLAIGLIQTLTKGHPVQIQLLLWALSFWDQKSQIDYDSLDSLLGEAVTRLESGPNAALRNTLCAGYRVTRQMLQYWELGEWYEFLEELPFAVTLSDSAAGFYIHPIANNLLASAMGLQQTDVNAVVRKLAYVIYPRLISEAAQKELINTLELEQLRHLASLSRREDFTRLVTAFRSRIRKGEYWRADEIAQIALENVSGSALTFEARLLSIEANIARHNISEASKLLEEITPSEISKTSNRLQNRFQYLKTKCVISPAALSGNAIFLAGETLERIANSLDQEGDLDDLLGDVLVDLAEAYRLTARYDDAIRTYDRVSNNTTQLSQKIRALEAQSQLARQLANFDLAEEAEQSASVIRLEAGIPASGFGLYGLASLRRDQNNFDAAEALYTNALKVAQDEGDDYLCCLILGDWAWMKFLSGDMKESRAKLDDYRKISEMYGFSRELSEVLHIQYHYEAEDENWKAAYSYLDRAYQLAEEYGNVLMQLDCLMHKVQRAVRNDDQPLAMQLLKTMREIEEKGCGIRVFRGRALIYTGDGYLETGNTRETLLAWCEGFEVVSDFGHSRSNTELLDELLDGRADRFSELLAKFPDVNGGWIQDISPRLKGAFLEARTH